MDTLKKQTEPPGQRKRRTKKKAKWPKWLRSGRTVRLVLIWGPRIYELGEGIFAFFFNSPGV